MEIRILGSRTSIGVPEIRRIYATCISKDPKGHRLRASALVQTGGATLSLDCGSDFREQMLHAPFDRIDTVLISHRHYDHVGSLDDLHPFCRFGEVPIYAETYTAERLRSRVPYCFMGRTYPGAPNILLREVEPSRPFLVNHAEVLPLGVMHDKLLILGYRIGKFGYIADMLAMFDESPEQLQGADMSVMNALCVVPHNTHQGPSEVLEAVKRIGAEEIWFIHMSHHIGLQADVKKLLLPHVHLVFDGLEIEC